MNSSRRTLMIILASVVAAGVIGAGLTALLWDRGNEPLSLASPTASTSPSPTITTSPSPSPSASVSPSPSASSSASPTASATSGGGAPPATQSAKSVNCDATPYFCSDTSGGMVIKDKKLVSKSTTPYNIDYSNRPRTSMTWKILHPANREANEGEQVSKLVISVQVHNSTNRTFVFPNREIAMKVTLNGKTIHELVTHGDPFEMRPGGTLKATFNIPIAFDGRYSWRAKTWFYEK